MDCIMNSFLAITLPQGDIRSECVAVSNACASDTATHCFIQFYIPITPSSSREITTVDERGRAPLGLATTFGSPG